MYYTVLYCTAATYCLSLRCTTLYCTVLYSCHLLLELTAYYAVQLPPTAEAGGVLLHSMVVCWSSIPLWQVFQMLVIMVAEMLLQRPAPLQEACILCLKAMKLQDARGGTCAHVAATHAQVARRNVHRAAGSTMRAMWDAQKGLWLSGVRIE